MPTCDALRSIDATLAKAGGVPPLTAWWTPTLQRFYESGARRFVGRVGRGGAKSHTAVKVALTEVLAGSWHVPPGERHYFAFISQNKSEAGQRLSQLEAWLRVLGVPFERRGDSIDLRELPLGFRVFACTVGAVSGFRCIGFVADEIAKWSNADGSANPAREVVASLRAMTVTHAGALEWFISSPLATSDYHYELFERGDSPDQFTAWAPSWVANPAITEADTRQRESDPRVHAREYGATPQAAALAAFPPEAIDRACRVRSSEEVLERSEAVLIVDPSSGRKDTWAWAICAWLTEEDPSAKYLFLENGDVLRRPDGAPIIRNTWKPRRPVLRFLQVGGRSGRFFEQASADDVVDEIAAVARRYRVRHVHSDQREAFALESMFRARGFRFWSHDYTNPSKQRAVERVRRWLADDILWLPQHEQLKSELLAFEERVTPSGALTFAARGSGHDDYVALLLTAALADENPGLPSTPYRLPPARGVGGVPIDPFSAGNFNFGGAQTDLAGLSVNEIRSIVRAQHEIDHS